MKQPKRPFKVGDRFCVKGTVMRFLEEGLVEVSFDGAQNTMDENTMMPETFAKARRRH